MYFYIFFVMYLASSFSNGLLFSSNPLNEKNELIELASSRLENIFLSNTNNKIKGMDYNEFKILLNNFRWLHRKNDNEIEELFKNEVNDINGFMNFDQFKKHVLNFIIIIESKIKNHYKKFLNKKNKMTSNNLIEALKKVKFDLTLEDACTLMTRFKVKDKQDIKMEEFREIIGYKYHEKFADLKKKKINNGN
ncbi:uncharacterized protein LOC126901299 isoform X3 [Daktulosphaira vitifoliae]|uniref:uncharacterized protein LOC126901299 isoform X3 n=1 Tax=Daktulosphaira vitifoliae TaxID=58002 RepID=UPI0021AAAF18|nr:uncharacterized protein LOC126901299 isoform X3 [Daktulosphaira vitifoliae]